MKIINIYFGIINILAFLMFAIDKYKAKKNYYRIPEKTLFMFCFLGGGIGGFISMYMMRHKVRKWYFNLFVPISIVIGIYVYYMLFTKLR